MSDPFAATPWDSAELAAPASGAPTTSNVPQPIPTSAYGYKVNPIARALIQEPRYGNSKAVLPGFVPLPKVPTDTTTAAVQSLQDEFADSLRPSEVAFYSPPKPPPPMKQSTPPKNFLQAHMVIIDQLLMDPSITVTKLAHVTGYSNNWLHKVMQSDAFQAKLAERQKALVEPLVLAAIKDRVSGLASRALEIIEERLESDKVSLDHALNVFGMTSKALGMGQPKAVAAQQNNFIVTIPAQMADAQDWATKHGGQPARVQVEPLNVIQAEPEFVQKGAE